MKCWPRIEPPHRGRARVLLAVLAALAPVLAAQEETAPVSGQLLSRYRGRFTGSESDHDLFETLDLALADPGGRWSGAVLARTALDSNGEGQDFFELLDAYDHRLQEQLFHAYVDLASRTFERLRFGRQPLYETPLTVIFDGVRAELAPLGALRLKLGAYAGVGEHLYESSNEDDFVFGSFGALRAWSGAELRADWMHNEDARLGVPHEDDLLGLALSQDIRGQDDVTRLEGRFTSLEGDGRDVRLSGSHVNGAAHASIQGSLYKLLQTQKQLAAPLDPFSDTLFELFPYYQLGLSATKDWTHLSMTSGADVRRLEQDSDEGEFNRDFERYYLTASLAETLWVTVALTGELWRATDSDYETWGAALSRAFEDGWDVELGSYFALYEYDLFSAEERDHVRSTYLDLRWKCAAKRRWGLRYEFERNDFDDYHQVRLDYTWGF